MLRADKVGSVRAQQPRSTGRHLDSLVPAGTPSNEIPFMLAALRPLLSEQVEHWLELARDVHGRPVKVSPAGEAGSTKHPARVIRMDGEVVMPFSRSPMADAKATLWLIDHPRPVAVGDTFELAGGEVLTVARAELRTVPGGTLSKVYLK